MLAFSKANSLISGLLHDPTHVAQKYMIDLNPDNVDVLY